ncbi:MAG: DNA topoisomerase [Oscillospiraceae bacterium]
MTPKTMPPPMLYDLTELQRDANKQYQMSPKETLAVMQRLYENYKALTYPRTDSRFLTDDIVPTLQERLRAVSKGEFAPIAGEILKQRRPIAKACVNNAKVSDHHAIIPTEQDVDMLKFSVAEKRIYMLVVRRFLTCFYPNYEYKSLRADLSCGRERFYATGRAVVQQGWKKVYDLRDEEGTTNRPADAL